MSERLDLYHRTTEEAARAIVETGTFVTRENTREAFVSTHVDGQAVGYGDAVVHVRIDEADAELDEPGSGFNRPANVTEKNHEELLEGGTA